MYQPRVDGLPTEREIHWPMVEVGPDIASTAAAVDRAVSAVCGVRLATGKLGTIGDFLQQAPAAVQGVPAELRLPG